MVCFQHVSRKMEVALAKSEQEEPTEEGCECCAAKCQPAAAALVEVVEPGCVPPQDDSVSWFVGGNHWMALISEIHIPAARRGQHDWDYQSQGVRR